MKITPTSLNVQQMLGTVNEQYVIPAYQRRYSWSERQIWELIDDIKLTEGNDTHLLGSIVCLTGPHNAGINELELVDGQQRLTTISIIIECLGQYFRSSDNSESARDAERLTKCRTHNGNVQQKIRLDSVDQLDFKALLNGNSSLHTIQNSRLETAFILVKRWIVDEEPESLSKFLYNLMYQAIIIRLDVNDAKDAFKLFETINNRGLRLSHTDIIKNFVLGNAARFGDESLNSARQAWTNLISYLDGADTDSFFRHFLIARLGSRVTASYVISSFKKYFMTEVEEACELPERHLYADGDGPEEDEEQEVDTKEDATVSVSNKISFKKFLALITSSSRIYGQLVKADTDDAAVNRSLRSLRMIKAHQTYGFIMHLMIGKCSDKELREILRLTESFILRRHICKERSNETDALFARLCGLDMNDPVDEVKNAYRELCPDDESFKKDFSLFRFTGGLIDRARYCLEMIELKKHGEHQELQITGSDSVHVEHIIPQKIKTRKAREEFGDWVEYLGENAEARHPKYMPRIGNLTLFSGALNIGASNNPFHKKRKAYKESAIMLTKELCDLSSFSFRSVDKRSDDLASMACSIWPIP